MKLRIALGAAGILLGLFGVFRLLTQIAVPDLEELAVWLVAAVVIHDGILSPLILGVGALLHRLVPSRRALASLQGGLIAGSLITVIALPMIHRAYTLPSAKAILEQDFAANLGILLAVVAGAAFLVYVATVIRDRYRSTSAVAVASPGDGGEGAGNVPDPGPDDPE